MKLFDLIFCNDIPLAGGLFYKSGSAYTEDGALIIPAGGQAGFGTYFNLFPYCIYRNYCGINSVRLTLSGSGDYTVKLCLQAKSGTVTVLKTEQAADNYSCVADTSALPDGGYLYFTIHTEKGCVLYGGGWSADSVRQRAVNIGIVICTYNRENFVRSNLGKICAGIAAEPEWADRLHVYVIDNAKSLNLEKSPYYTVIKNRNLGGSGGFTRGMREVAESGRFTHMLLMDDDISFEFETLKRTWRLAACLGKDHSEATIGGSMLILETPYIQQEQGGLFNGLRIDSVNGKLDVREAENLIKNENAAAADYQAWWYCCMPVSYVKKYGYPLPLFIKIDDIEYGLRCCREIIFSNGLAVWHSDFIAKYNGALEYYTKRNEAIVCAIYSRRTRFTVAAKLMYTTHRQMLLKDYTCVENILSAYDDFMKGSSFIMQTDPEALNKEVMARRPRELSYGEIEEICGVNPDDVKYREPGKSGFFKKAMLLTENFLPSFCFKDGTAVADMCRLIPSRSYLKKTVIRCNSLSKTGYVCRLDVKRRNKLRRRIWKTLFRILFRYGKYSRDYKANAAAMCSEGHWDELFNG